MTDSTRKSPLYPLWLASMAVFVVAAASGAAFRWELISSTPSAFSLSNIRHAHSHLMLMGWATPALMVCMARLWPAEGARSVDRSVALVGWVAWALALASFPAFLFFGYESVDIGPATMPIAAVLSGLAILSWYGFAAIYFGATRGVRRTPAVRLWDLSVGSLVVSSVGAWAIAGLMAAGVDNPLWEAATVHFFVDLFGLGWLVLGVLGLFVALADIPETTAGRTGRTLIVIGIAFVFLVGLPRQNAPEMWLVVGSAAACVVAVGLALTTSVVWPRLKRWPRIAVGFLMVQIAMLAALSIPPLAEWGVANGLRILFLHVAFGGFVTVGLVVAAGRLWSNDATGSPLLWLLGMAALLATLIPLTGLWPTALGGEWVMTSAFAGSVVAVVATAVATARAFLFRTPPETQQ